MIQINLLPQEAEAMAGGGARAPRQPGAAQGLVIAVLVVLVMLAIPAVGGGFLFIASTGSASALKDAKAREERAADEVKKLETEYEEVREGLEVARKQWRILQSLNNPDRLLWTEKLNILPLLVPDGIYLTRIRVSEEITEVETPESRAAFNAWNEKTPRQGSAPRREYTPVIIQTLVLEGISYVPDGTSDERLDKIIRFINALENDMVPLPHSGSPVNFMDKFTPNVDWTRFEDTRMNDRVVQEFTLTITSRPFGGET